MRVRTKSWKPADRGKKLTSISVISEISGKDFDFMSWF
jgi:hypothetical protein